MPKRTAKLSSEERIKDLTNMANGLSDEDEGPKQSSLESLKNLKDLILLGRLEKTVELNGYRFRISTLSNLEQNNVLKLLMKKEEMDRLLFAKAAALSFSIRDINGIPLDELCDDEEGDIEDARLSFLMNLQSSTIEKLFSTYEALLEESLAETDVEDVKK